MCVERDKYEILTSAERWQGCDENRFASQSSVVSSERSRIDDVMTKFSKVHVKEADCGGDFVMEKSRNEYGLTV